MADKEDYLLPEQIAAEYISKNGVVLIDGKLIPLHKAILLLDKKPLKRRPLLFVWSKINPFKK